MRLFDTYIAVDWSSSNKAGPTRPIKNALWVGEATVTDKLAALSVNETYWPTRKQCIDYIRALLLHHAQAGHRVLIGFDFAYGYPTGYAAALGLHGDASPWRLLWDEISRLVKDDERNRNNRFEVAAELNARCDGITPGPMWGCPINLSLPNLMPTSPQYPFVTKSGLSIERLRWADKATGGVQPVWKLFAPGSVGGQCIVGIPAVRNLRYDPELASFSRVWPFETGFTSTPVPDAGPFILHVEIWPGVVPLSSEPAITIRDQAQVRAVVKWFASLDAQENLFSLFEPPAHLSHDAAYACIQEEGWIIGGDTRQRQPLT